MGNGKGAAFVEHLKVFQAPHDSGVRSHWLHFAEDRDLEKFGNLIPGHTACEWRLCLTLWVEFFITVVDFWAQIFGPDPTVYTRNGRILNIGINNLFSFVF